MLPIFRQIKIFSKSIIFTTTILYLIDFFLHGRLSEYFTLNPEKIVTQFEYWRLIAFPFAFSTNEAYIFFLIVFWFVSDNLEDILRQSLYPALLLLLTLLQGVSMTLIYWGENVNIAGMEGISFFVLAFFIILNPASKVQLFQLKPIPTILFSALIITAWTTVKLMHFIGDDALQSTVPFSSAGMGILMGLLTSFQIKYIRRKQRKKIIEKANELKIPKAEELSMAFMSKYQKKRYSEHSEDDNRNEFENDHFELSDDPHENEHKLNEILDKINDKGADALSPSELEFLKKYSKTLE